MEYELRIIIEETTKTGGIVENYAIKKANSILDLESEHKAKLLVRKSKMEMLYTNYTSNLMKQLLISLIAKFIFKPLDDALL